MKKIVALIWSEWRRQRKSFFLLLSSTVLLCLVMAGMIYFRLFIRSIGTVSIVLAIGVNVLYAVVLGDAFASEFTNKSNSFLLGLPISKTKIYFVKYISNFLPFLLLSSFGTMSMYICNMFLSQEFSLTGILLPVKIFVSLGIVVQAAVFFCNLVNRNSNNGVIMLLILPVLLVILAPGVFSVNMFFFATDAYWLISSTISTIIILYLIFLMSGWYLWNMRISKGLKCLRPILKIIGIMISVSALLYCLAWIYVNYQYNSALREAKANNFVLQESEGFYKVKIPKALIVFNEYIRTHKISRMPVYKKLANRPYETWKTLRKQQKSDPKYLNEQNVKKIYSILTNTSEKYEIDNVKDFYVTRFNTRVAVIFLIDMAYIQAQAGKIKDFFNSLIFAAEYCKSLKQIEPIYYDSIAEFLSRLIYYAIITTGPEGPAYADDYKEALNFILDDKVYCPPYEFLPGLCYVIALSNPKSDLKPISLYNSIYYCLRFKQGLASWIRYEIKRKKLYLEAEKMSILKEILNKNKKLRQEAKNIFGYCRIMVYPGGLESYFRDRCGMAGDKICLALKIFRCRHGKYPEKLQELCPEILKKMPVDPINGNAYTYKKQKDGFILFGGFLTMHGHSKTIATIRSYKREYQPWEPREKEKNK